MATTATIPITVSEEAALRLQELGMQREFDMMIEYTRETTSGLLALEATLEYDPEEARDPTVTIWARRHEHGPQGDGTDWNWAAWLVRLYPPRVCSNFVMISVYEPVNERESIP